MSGLFARLLARLRPAPVMPSAEAAVFVAPWLPAPSPKPALPQTGPRSWRNCNPGNVRPVALPDKWVGQVAIDAAPGGPFSIFETPAYGFRAICKVLLKYQRDYSLRSVRAMLYRYAPPMENPTDAYVASVCKALMVGPDDAVDVMEPRVMRQLLVAIAAVEGGKACPRWADADMAAGMKMAGVG